MAKNSELATVRIDAEVVEKVREFSDRTGIPMSRVITDSVEGWLKSVGKQILAARESPV